LPHRVPDFLGARHVQRYRPRAAARGLDLRGRGHDLLLGARGAGDTRARFRQGESDGTAEAAARPGDERGATFEGEETLRAPWSCLPHPALSPAGEEAAAAMRSATS